MSKEWEKKLGKLSKKDLYNCPWGGGSEDPGLIIAPTLHLDCVTPVPEHCTHVFIDIHARKTPICAHAKYNKKKKER